MWLIHLQRVDFRIANKSGQLKLSENPISLERTWPEERFCKYKIRNANNSFFIRLMNKVTIILRKIIF